MSADDWIYIGARGNGEFTGKKEGDHLLGGPMALSFLPKQTNSDIENVRTKPNAPEAQLYDLKYDQSQTINVIRQHPKIAAGMRAELEQIKNHATAPHTRSH